MTDDNKQIELFVVNDSFHGWKMCCTRGEQRSKTVRLPDSHPDFGYRKVIPNEEVDTSADAALHRMRKELLANRNAAALKLAAADAKLNSFDQWASTLGGE